MRPSRSTIAALCIVASFVVVGLGCKKKPPKHPAPEPVEAATAEPTPPPPPPKPKCESFDEKCKAEADTKVDIGTRGNVSIAEGWTYAKVGDAAVSMSPHDDALLVLVPADGPDPDKILAALTPVLDKYKMNDKVGTLLVVVAPLSGGVVVGAGFAAETDDKGKHAQAIMQSVNSLRSAK
jgi:hypothetical protein